MGRTTHLASRVLRVSLRVRVFIEALSLVDLATRSLGFLSNYGRFAVHTGAYGQILYHYGQPRHFQGLPPSEKRIETDQGKLGESSQKSIISELLLRSPNRGLSGFISPFDRF
jgi:hypothetical protein